MEKKNYLVAQRAEQNVFDVAYTIAKKLISKPPYYIDFFDANGWSDTGVTKETVTPRFWAIQAYNITETLGSRPMPDMVTYGFMLNEEYEIYLTEVESINVIA